MGRGGEGIVGEEQSNSRLRSSHYWETLHSISKVYRVVAIRMLLILSIIIAKTVV